MKYTEQDLVSSLQILLPTAKNMIECGIHVPRVCTIVAEICFRDQIPECYATKVLRQALKDLQSPGYFNFQK